MAYLEKQLEIDSCPHCGRANPTLQRWGEPFSTETNTSNNRRFWGIYVCRSCGGVVSAYARNTNDRVMTHGVARIYPSVTVIDESIPEKPRELLRQAQNTLHAPAGSIMLSASAIDAMLKEKGCTVGSLYDRIDKAAADGLITADMATWAHQIRLEANDQRHADEGASLPTTEDAELTFDFAVSFAEYLFVLPSRVTRGITASVPE